MNKMMKAAAVLLAATFAASAFAGCRAKRAANTEQDLEIALWQAGAGRAFLDRVAAAYEKKYPDVNVTINAGDTQLTQFQNAPGTDTVDLYLSTMEDYPAYANNMEPLEGILAEKVDGNDVAIGDKLDADVIERSVTDDGHLYVLPWNRSINGLVYNRDVFEDNGYKLPRTTNELIDLALTVKADGLTPFIYYAPYWRYCYEVWQAQYDGVDAYFDRWQAAYTDADGVRHAPDLRAFTDPDVTGKRLAYDVLYELISPQGYAYNGTNALSHTASQTFFLGGAAVMMPNGSWVENEMKGTENAPDIGMMKMPVLSALGKKLGISENALRAAVAYADGETLGPADQAAVDGMSKEVLDSVREARNLYYSELAQHHMFVPGYAVAKEAALNFIRFFYSDEALRIIAEEIQFCVPADLGAGDYDTAAWTSFAKNAYALHTDARYIFKVNTNKLFYDGGVTQLFHYDPAKEFTYGSASKTPTAYWSAETQYWQENWSALLTQAGIE